MVHRNNAGRLGSGFISVCLETRWRSQKSGFYVLERYCRPVAYKMICALSHGLSQQLARHHDGTVTIVASSCAPKSFLRSAFTLRIPREELSHGAQHWQWRVLTEIHMVIEIHMHMSRGVHVYEQRKQMYMDVQIDAYECENMDAYLWPEGKS